MTEEEQRAHIEREVQRFKMKKLINQLDGARGNGTSMITLMLTPKDSINRMTTMLGEEQGTAQNIKSHVNKLSVLSAISSSMQRLKLYTKTPPTGLAIFCGTVVIDNNKEKKVTIDVIPFKAIPRTMYMCDNRFHTEALRDMLESDDKYGFVIMDGNGTLFATLQGSVREVIHRLSVDLPKKHSKGGQSSMRFARIRLEKRLQYIKKIAELVTQLFITNDRPNVSGLILAGSAEFKNFLSKKEMMDERLRPIIMKIVDIAYGADNGLNQAIELSADVLSNVKFVHEKRVISKFFGEIRDSTNRYSAGVVETVAALNMAAVETLILWEDLRHVRVTVHHPTQGERIVVCLPEEMEKRVNPVDENGNKLEYSVESLSEWIAENYEKFNCQLEIVTNKSSEGMQFVRGFGGIGGILRYALDMKSILEQEEEKPAAPAGAAPAGADAAAAADPTDPPAPGTRPAPEEAPAKPANPMDMFDDDDFM